MGESTKKPTAKTKSIADVAEEFFQIDQQKISEPNADQIKTDNDWLADSYDGQLSIDVYQTAKEIIIKSTIAGAKPENIDISINKDMVTIRGVRQEDEQIAEEDYLYKECYWGGFSRSIILPTNIKADKVKATLKNGILTVILPKINRPKSQSIKVKEEE